MSISAFFKSFVYAYKGLKVAILERNFRLHLISMSLTIIASWYLHITSIEWCIILICIGGVISLEIVNTAIEYIVNFISPERQDQAGKIKDLAAAAVLVFSIVACIIAIIIFYPYVYSQFFDPTIRCGG